MSRLVKKVKFDKDFIKERLNTIALEESIKPYLTLKDKHDDIGDKGVALMRKRLDANTDTSLKNVDATVKNYQRGLVLLEKLKISQQRRRVKLFDWFKNYVDYMENQERGRLVMKYNISLKIPGLDDVVFEEYKFEETLFLDEKTTFEVKQEAFENKAHGVNIAPEKVEIEEESEKAAEQADTHLLAASEAPQVEKKEQEEKKETSGEEKETAQKKAERFLQEATS